jgi:hypothetical protein
MYLSSSPEIGEARWGIRYDIYWFLKVVKDPL